MGMLSASRDQPVVITYDKLSSAIETRYKAECYNTDNKINSRVYNIKIIKEYLI